MKHKEEYRPEWPALATGHEWCWLILAVLACLVWSGLCFAFVVWITA